jgi:ArsR family transcriptional regulator
VRLRDIPAIAHEQSNTSRHLNYTQAKGILARRKDGVKIYYASTADLATEIMKLEVVFRNVLIKKEEGESHERTVYRVAAL